MFAIAPPTKPATRPGRSAILIPINPASTGSINPKETPPTFLKKAASGVLEPKLEGLAGS